MDTLASVREPFNGDVQWHTDLISDGAQRTRTTQDPLQHQKSTRKVSHCNINDLYVVDQKGSHLQLDTALATTPLGRGACRAVYWIHPENVVQLQILLLQYTRIPNWHNSTAPPGSLTNPRASPRSSISGQVDGCANTAGQDFGLIVCDDLEQFALRQCREPIGDVETSSGSVAERAAVSIRYSPDKELFLAINNSSRGIEKTCQPIFLTTKIRRKSLRYLFNHSDDEEFAVADSREDLQKARLWLAEHPSVVPLAQIEYKRSHFIGIKNSKTAGIWATLDTEVHIRRCLRDSILQAHGSLLSTDEEPSDSQQFPFAVLEVRMEGPDDSGLVAMLDTSHLVSYSNTIIVAT